MSAVREPRTGHIPAPDERARLAATLGATLRALRAEHRLSTRRLAERAAVARSTITRLERGERRPRPAVLAAIAYGLDPGRAHQLAAALRAAAGDSLRPDTPGGLRRRRRATRAAARRKRADVRALVAELAWTQAEMYRTADAGLAAAGRGGGLFDATITRILHLDHRSDVLTEALRTVPAHPLERPWTPPPNPPPPMPDNAGTPGTAPTPGPLARTRQATTHTAPRRKRPPAPAGHGPRLDEVDPPRPHDPPWRSRTAHRTLPADVATMLREAREDHGWSLREAARRTGVSARMLALLERGQRRPSITLAEDLADAYDLDPRDDARLMAVALPNVGRDSPYRRPGRNP